MAFNYKKMQNIAISKIQDFGTTFKVELEDTTAIREDYEPKATIQYEVKGLFLPPVNGMYFDRTRFGQNGRVTNDLEVIKRACVIAPLFIDNIEIKLDDIMFVIDKDNVRYKVVFIDTFRPTDKTMFYSCGLGV